MLPVAMTYVLPVLWMTSRFHTVCSMVRHVAYILSSENMSLNRLRAESVVRGQTKECHGPNFDSDRATA